MNEFINSEIMTPLSSTKLLSNISMDEYIDLESMIYESIQDAITDIVLRYSHPKFHENLIDEICRYIF